MKRYPILFLILGIFTLGFFVNSEIRLLSPTGNAPEAVATPFPSPSPVPTAKPLPTPIPLPDPKVYGPCKSVPVLLYHHVQPIKEIVEKKQQNISVDSEMFDKQMEYLGSRGYHPLTLSGFFSGIAGSLPAKPIVLTFDDGYEDFYTYAYPVLKKYNITATVFLPTGLLGNPGYLNWGQVEEIKGSGLVTFANHTWSHKSLLGISEDAVRSEIATAKTQLEEHGLGPVEFFAYPYGSESQTVEKVLKELGIKGAFTTLPGWQQCAKLPYTFRRNRVGSAPLSSYGL